MAREIPEPKVDKPADILNLGFNVASAYGACLWPFTRSHFGSHAFAGYPLSLIGMVVYAGWRNCDAMMTYLVVWLVALIYRRLTADRNQHSRFQGYPWVFGWMANQHVAKLGECFIAFALAVYYSTVDGAMTDFFMCMIPALILVEAVQKARDTAWKRQRRDAEVIAEHMRDL
jgi:hypothetical protein